MRVYLASRFARREEMKGYIYVLEAAGLVSSARWLTEETDMRAAEYEERQRFAIMDIEDVAKSDALVAFTEEPDTEGGARGGRHVEFGVAIAMNKTVVIVGPRENIFHYLPGLPQCETLEEAINYLKGEGQ